MSGNLLSDLKKALKAFNKEELVKYVAPLLQLSQNFNVVEEIKRLKLQPNAASIIQLFLDSLEGSDLSPSNLTEKLELCQLWGIALHPNRRKWSSIRFRVKEVTHDDLMSTKEFHFEFKRALKRNGVFGTVTVAHHKNTMWVNIVQKKIISKRLKSLAPVFLACFQRVPFMFFCSRSPAVSILQAAAEVQGFANFEKCSLTGENVDSMLNLLLNKGLRPGTSLRIPLANAVKETANGIDFTQSDNRRQYMEDLFGPDPPKMSKLIVEARNVPWQGNHDFHEMKTITTTTTIQYCTTDVVGMFKELGKEGILNVPPPTYVKNITNSGRNYIKLKAPGNVQL